MDQTKKEKSGLRRRAQELRTKIADPSGSITQEIYRKNVELAQTNRTLSLLRTIDNLVLETENSLDELCQGIAGAIVDDSKYLFSALFIHPSARSHAQMELKGFGISEYAKQADLQATLVKSGINAEATWFADKQRTKVIEISEQGTAELGGLFMPDASTFVELGTSLKGESFFLLKLIARKKLVGVFMVCVAMPATGLNLNEMEYLGRIGEAAGLAIDNKLLFEENQKVLKELKKSNEKLKALDEAKDEFISMASHQLRTPLTSVKGYVSMVLEGDVGRISQQQRDMLEQAFTSSQRMVYLIADLLNVSRLKTGKFVIETVPSQLADVVEGEMSQLKETAKARNLELVFEKPLDFPIVNVDETKTRQVIMNFIDNAIYYTPAGGHIRVELTATPKSIEYRVTDDGLGVPKAEQHHLFTKFYRADNAKKARPDGTGLGLYMAKKVIASQGGSIIFESEENKGSTFGFILPREKLAESPPKSTTATTP